MSKSPKVWQIGAGDGERSYPDICLKWDVILNGPGRYGPWPNCQQAMSDVGWSKHKIADIRKFYEEIKDGDIVILKIGRSKAYGVGVVIGNEPLWSDHFGDIDGWTIQFIRRVKWKWTYSGKPKTFHQNAFKIGTAQLVDIDAVKQWAIRLVEKSPSNRKLVQLLTSGNSLPLKRLDEMAIAEALFDKGMSSNAINKLNSEIGELIRIAKWYDRSDIQPSEHETVSYLLVPLLRVLGWTPQIMAVEWKNIDIALFSSLPRKEENIEVIIEAKKKGRSCFFALDQAKGYANKYHNCKRMIVSDGIRYAIYLKGKSGFPKMPNAYLNLTRMVENYPAYGCKGAIDAFHMMSADWSF